jgi:Na_pump_decarbB: sodium ion-translocating decarboxylase, beta subunit
MKKRLGIIAGILGIVLAVIGIVLKQKENTAVSVIGGADGPTSIFIAGKLNVDNFIFMIVVGIILLILAGVIFTNVSIKLQFFRLCMAEEPGKCRYIMGILEKNKKSKGTAFVYDENNDYYKMEINGIEFVCDSIHSDYEKHAVELAQAYEKRLPDIVDYLMPDIKEMFGITNPDVIANSLGKPSIDLDRGTLTYLEHTMDSLHIIEMEFDGIFTAFYNSCIDG